MGVVHIRSFVLMMVVVTLTMVVADSGSATPNAQLRGSKWTIHVFNNMLPEDVLFLHCKSKDDDLGEHNVTHNQQFSWSFKENFWRTTLFWCYFSSPYGHVEFKVFWPEKRHTWLESHYNWSDCIWIAKEDGIYLVNIPRQMHDYKHDWNKTASLLILN